MHKILHLIGKFDEDSGGAQRVIVDIVKHVGSKEFDMGVCSFFGKATLSKALPRAYQKHFDNKLKYDPLLFYKVSKVIDDWQPDLVHVHSPVVALFGRFIAYKKGIPLVSTIHTNVRKMSLRNRLLDKFTIGISDFNICVSEQVERSVIDCYKKDISPNAGLKIIYNCIDCDQYWNKVVENETKLRQILGAGSSMIIGTVGRLHPQKGHKFLIRAWEKIIEDKYQDILLLIIGGGKLRKKLQQMINRKGLNDSIKLLGRRNDVPDLLNLMDIFVFPSLYEGLSVALLEAMCMEKVIIASNIKSSNQVMGNTGILVPPHDDEALSKAIKKTIDNFNEIKELGKRAKTRVEKKFSPEEFGEKYSAVYGSIFQKGHI